MDGADSLSVPSSCVPSPCLSPTSSHSSSSSTSEPASSSSSPLSHPATPAQPSLNPGSQWWECPFECGQHYKRSSGRSIRRHVNVCFRLHNPAAATLTDEQLASIINQQQASGQLRTGLRRWKMRQPRRLAEELADSDRWDCVWGCGKSYRATSSRSIQRHANSCYLRSDGRSGSVDVKRLWRQSREGRNKQRRMASQMFERASSDPGEVDSGGSGGGSVSSSPAYTQRTGIASTVTTGTVFGMPHAPMTHGVNTRLPAHNVERKAAVTESNQHVLRWDGHNRAYNDNSELETEYALSAMSSSWPPASFASTSNPASDSSQAPYYTAAQKHQPPVWLSSSSNDAQPPTASVTDYTLQQQQHSAQPDTSAWFASPPESFSSSPLAIALSSEAPSHGSESELEQHQRITAQLRLFAAAFSHNQHALPNSYAAQDDTGRAAATEGAVDSNSSGDTGSSNNTFSSLNHPLCGSLSRSQVLPAHSSFDPTSPSPPRPSFPPSPFAASSPPHRLTPSPPAAPPSSAPSSDDYLIALSRFLQSSTSTWHRAPSRHGPHP